MLNKHIIGELFEIAQNYEDGSFKFEQSENANVFYYKQIILIAENSKLTVLCNSNGEYLITVSNGRYINYLDLLSKKQALRLLYFLKTTYDICKEYPNAFHNALEQMYYKYEREMEIE